jgi:ADP-ribosyl-[dinitrogen reductase] hydrolase
MEMHDRFHGCLLGLACGDAVGTTVEFKPRGTFPSVTDMVGGGPFGLKAGEWTDDTSMALCLATSLVTCSGFDPRDQMARYCRWRDEGYFSSNGRCFDIGNTIAGALRRYQATGDPFSGSADPHTAGNGSLMRLAPVPMAYMNNLEKVAHLSGKSSCTTHGAQEAIDACRLFGVMLARALRGEPKTAILGSGYGLDLVPAIRAIAKGSYNRKTRQEIKGSGYVVHSMEAALWCFYHTESYRDAILEAANLGDDADTTAAICGQIAGAYYGVEAIPAGWLSKLALREIIERLADQLYEMGTRE